MPSLPVLVVIPARAGSSRLPRKPLAEIAGKTLVERVWLQAKKASSVARVVVATDDSEIEKLCKGFGAEVLMTSPEIKTGSERVAEAAKIIAGQDSKRPEEVWSCVVNVQGDMPFVAPEVINSVVSVVTDADGTCDISTTATPIFSQEEFESNKIVKAVISENGDAHYFSRSPVPCSRDGERYAPINGETVYGYKHIGLYAFNPSSLDRFTALEQSSLEKIEMLEQLRALDHGMSIKVYVADKSVIGPSVEVDTAEDLERAAEVARSFDS